MKAFFLVLLLAGPARAAGLPEFEGALLELRGAVLSHPLSLGLALKARTRPRPKIVKRVTDPQTWARLLERARQVPTATLEMKVGDTEYKVFAVFSESRLPAQVCAADAKPRNALYVAQAVSGPGGAVYPVRLASVCVGPALTEQLFALDADADGSIQDAAMSEPGQGRSLHPTEEALSPAETARFEAYMAALVALFSGTP